MNDHYSLSFKGITGDEQSTKEKHTPVNDPMSGRTLIISDLHGMYDELLRVLDAVSCTDSDRLVFIGDYIDRGAQSREVFDLMVKLREDPINIFLRGNHEEMVLRLLDGETA